jgi:hypothetical protein
MLLKTTIITLGITITASAELNILATTGMVADITVPWMRLWAKE